METIKKIDYERIIKMYEAGKTWKEISEEVDGFTDTDRKRVYGYIDCMGYSKEELEEKLRESLAKREQNIRLAKKELGIERSINNEQIRDIAIHKTMTKQVLDSIGKLPHIDYYVRDIPFYNPQEKLSHIITLADLHYTGDEDELRVFNNVISKIKQLVDNNDIEHIYLVELGDVIEGASLRNSQLMGVKKGMVQQTIHVAEAYAQMLSKISEFVHVTFISVDSSNHTQLRNLGTKQNELVEEDLMQVFNTFIEARLPDLEVIRGTDVLHNIAGFNCFFAHGHLVKSKEGYLDKLANSRNVNIDFGFFGHYHHMRVIDLYGVDDGDKRYDKRVIYVPALTNQETTYERDRMLSAISGIGYFVIDENSGMITNEKVVV